MTQPAKSKLVHVYAPHFTAGVVLEDGRVVRAAPIVKYMLGWTEARVRTYVDRKRWMVFSRESIPDADLKRASNYVRERGWVK